MNRHRKKVGNEQGRLDEMQAAFITAERIIYEKLRIRTYDGKGFVGYRQCFTGISRRQNKGVNIMEKQEFLDRFKKIVDDTWALFKQKNEQYGTEDPFANFRAAAALSMQNVNYPGMYKTLQEYMLKHIAHVYNNDIDGMKVRESLGDIVVYSIIGMVMVDAWKELNQYGSGENKAKPETGKPKNADALDAFCYAHACDKSKGKDKTMTAVLLDNDMLKDLDEEEFTKLCERIFKGINKG